MVKYLCNKNIVGWEDFSLNDNQLILINQKFGYRLIAEDKPGYVQVSLNLIRSFRQNINDRDHLLELKEKSEHMLRYFFYKSNVSFLSEKDNTFYFEVK